MFGDVLQWFLQYPFRYVKTLIFTDYFDIGSLSFSVGDVLVGSFVICFFIRAVFNRYGIAREEQERENVRQARAEAKEAERINKQAERKGKR